MEHKTIYCRHTDVNGNSFVREHRVWNESTFLRSQADACEEANRKHTDGIGRAKIERISRDEYHAEK